MLQSKHQSQDPEPDPVTDAGHGLDERCETLTAGVLDRIGGPVEFKREDATCLTFSDDSFDLVYSISVIEHIYEDRVRAISEMVRVTRLGGLIYITYPVARQIVEECVDFPIYPDQAVRDGRTFFLYRFGSDRVADIIRRIPDTVEVIRQDIFWERRKGLYDWLVQYLRSSGNPWFFGRLKSALLNLALGLIFFERTFGAFEKHKKFGNAHITLKKHAVWPESGLDQEGNP